MFDFVNKYFATTILNLRATIQLLATIIVLQLISYHIIRYGCKNYYYYYIKLIIRININE
jgi:hypothetical protein